MSNINRSAFQGHPFHLVSPSPWPIYTWISLFILINTGFFTMHSFSYAGYLLVSALVLFVLSLYFCYKDDSLPEFFAYQFILNILTGLEVIVAPPIIRSTFDALYSYIKVSTPAIILAYYMPYLSFANGMGIVSIAITVYSSMLGSLGFILMLLAAAYILWCLHIPFKSLRGNFNLQILIFSIAWVITMHPSMTGAWCMLLRFTLMYNFLDIFHYSLHGTHLCITKVIKRYLFLLFIGTAFVVAFPLIIWLQFMLMWASPEFAELMMPYVASTICYFGPNTSIDPVTEGVDVLLPDGSRGHLNRIQAILFHEQLNRVVGALDRQTTAYSYTFAELAQQLRVFPPADTNLQDMKVAIARVGYGVTLDSVAITRLGPGSAPYHTIALTDIIKERSVLFPANRV